MTDKHYVERTMDSFVKNSLDLIKKSTGTSAIPKTGNFVAIVYCKVSVNNQQPNC